MGRRSQKGYSTRDMGIFLEKDVENNSIYKSKRECAENDVQMVHDAGQDRTNSKRQNYRSVLENIKKKNGPFPTGSENVEEQNYFGIKFIRKYLRFIK